MRILKVFNNNAVAAVSNELSDIIVLGSGIGFQKKANDFIDEKRIEKIYVVEEKSKKKFEESLRQVDSKYFEMTTKIVNKASKDLHTEFNSEIFVAISDHISFAIKRKEENVYLPNIILDETKALYQKEYAIGAWAIAYIKKRWGIELEEGEAGYIALHLVNYSMNSCSNNAIRIISLTKDVLQVIQNELQVNLEKDSLAYTRLSTHLKYLAERIFRNANEEFPDTTFSIRKLLYKDYRMESCINCICKVIQERFNYELSPNEKTFLVIHIKNNVDRVSIENKSDFL